MVCTLYQIIETAGSDRTSFILAKGPKLGGFNIESKIPKLAIY